MKAFWEGFFSIFNPWVAPSKSHSASVDELLRKSKEPVRWNNIPGWYDIDPWYKQGRKDTDV